MWCIYVIMLLVCMICCQVCISVNQECQASSFNCDICFMVCLWLRDLLVDLCLSNIE